LQQITASYKNCASASKEQRRLPHSELKSRGEAKSSSQIGEFTLFDCAHGLATIAPDCESDPCDQCRLFALSEIGLMSD
jgi:hypothetical protein